jgi:uncharacterized damage-inducible protein DinB
MVDIRRLYEYDELVRQRYLDKLGQISWDELSRNREATHNSLKNIQLHMIFVLQRLVEHVIKGGPVPTIDYDSFKTYADVTEYVDAVTKKVREYLSGVGESEFQREVEFRRRDGSIMMMKVEEVLLQGFVEQLYHRGEIIALLWQMDIEPPPMQWFLNRPGGN